MKARHWVGCMVGLTVLGFLTGIVLRTLTSPKEKESLVTLAVGDSHELSAGRKIVFLSMQDNEVCQFKLIECAENSCVTLEDFALSMTGDGPSNEWFFGGYKVLLFAADGGDPQAQTVELKISKMQ